MTKEPAEAGTYAVVKSTFEVALASLWFPAFNDSPEKSSRPYGSSCRSRIQFFPLKSAEYSRVSRCVLARILAQSPWRDSNPHRSITVLPGRNRFRYRGVRGVGV